MVAAIKYRVRGYAGNRASEIVVNAPDTISIENIVGYAKELAPIIDSMIDGYIDRVSTSISIALPAGIKPNALANSDLEQGAWFLFKPRTRSHRIPAFDTAFFLYGIDPTELPVDVSAPAVAALADALLNGLDATPGGGDQVVVPVDSRGDLSIEYDGIIGEIRNYKK